MITCYISTAPENFGSDASAADAERCAKIIRDRISELYPNAEFKIGEERDEYEIDDEDQFAAIEQAISDNWVKWVNDYWAGDWTSDELNAI